MNKTIPLIAIISVILVAGTIGFVISSPDAFGSGQGKGNDEDKGKEGHGQQGCETATEASDGKTKNPHCAEETTQSACLCIDDSEFEICSAEVDCNVLRAECADFCSSTGIDDFFCRVDSQSCT